MYRGLLMGSLLLSACVISAISWHSAVGQEQAPIPAASYLPNDHEETVQRETTLAELL